MGMGMGTGGGKGAGMGMGGGLPANAMQGDWMCTNCGEHNFARNVACRKCGAPKVAGYGGAGMGMGMAMGKGMYQDAKPGDWVCTSCGDHNFARNEACRKCGAPKPS